MATTNIAVTPAWVKLADASAIDFLATWDVPVTVEFATTAADTAPTVVGHKLGPGSAITRIILGAGYVWARLVAGSKPASVNMIVSK